MLDLALCIAGAGDHGGVVPARNQLAFAIGTEDPPPVGFNSLADDLAGREVPGPDRSLAPVRRAVRASEPDLGGCQCLAVRTKGEVRNTQLFELERFANGLARCHVDQLDQSAAA